MQWNLIKYHISGDIPLAFATAFSSLLHLFAFGMIAVPQICPMPSLLSKPRWHPRATTVGLLLLLLAQAAYASEPEHATPDKDQDKDQDKDKDGGPHFQVESRRNDGPQCRDGCDGHGGWGDYEPHDWFADELPDFAQGVP